MSAATPEQTTVVITANIQAMVAASTARFSSGSFPAVVSFDLRQVYVLPVCHAVSRSWQSRRSIPTF